MTITSAKTPHRFLSALRFNRAAGWLVILAVLAGWLTACGKSGAPRELTEVILTDATSYFYLDPSLRRQPDSRLPVGIFDSGTGGLTVLEALLTSDYFDNVRHVPLEKGDGRLDFRRETFIYLADQANMPYGNYTLENNADLLREHILKNVQFLLSNKYYRAADTTGFQQDKSPVKALVIACNTASAIGKNDVVNFLRRAEIHLKVIGVIDAGVRGALHQIGDSENCSVGVLATATTVATNAYPTTFGEQARAAGKTGKIVVFQQAGIGLAEAIDGMAEGISELATGPRDAYRGPALDHPTAKIDLAILERYGFDRQANHLLIEGAPTQPKAIQINSIANYIAYHLVSLLEQIRQTPGAPPLKVIVLACTHYPFFTDIFQTQLERLYNYREDGQFIYRHCLAQDVVWIDPAEFVARELYEHLRASNLLNDAGVCTAEFYINVPNILNPNIRLTPDGQFSYAYKYGRQAGAIQEYVKAVPFSRRTLSPDVIARLATKSPRVFTLLRRFNQQNPKLKFLPDRDRI